MNLKLITAATTEPVSLIEAKAHLRVTDSNSDTLISSLIKTARQHCENFTGRALASQTFELIMDSFPSVIELPMPPVTSLIATDCGIKYKDSDGVETTLASTEYIFYDSEPAVIVNAYGKSWPTFIPYPIGAVKVRYVAGYTTNIPEPIKQAIMLLVGHLYENREAINIGNIINEVPFGVTTLLFPYRIWSL